MRGQRVTFLEMVSLTIYGLTFEFDLPEEIASPFLAEFPAAWLERKPTKRVVFSARVECKKGHYRLQVGEVNWRQSTDPRAIVMALGQLVRQSLARRDARHGYLWGGAARWQGHVCAVLGYPGKGTTTLLGALAQTGAEVLSDGILMVTGEGRIVPFPAASSRSLMADRFFFVARMPGRAFSYDKLSPGGTASLVFSRCVPNERFFPAFAALARNTSGYYVLRDEAEDAVERMQSLLEKVPSYNGPK